VKRAALLVVAAAVAIVDLAPLALILKQALTPERESFAWPPTWRPHAVTLENFRTVTGAVEFGRGVVLSLGVAGATVAAALALALPAAWLAARRPTYDRPLDVVMVVTRVFPRLRSPSPWRRCSSASASTITRRASGSGSRTRWSGCRSRFSCCARRSAACRRSSRRRRSSTAPRRPRCSSA